MNLNFKVKAKFFSQNLEDLNEFIKRVLKIKSENLSLVRLPSKVKTYVLKKNYVGEGYGTYVKVIHKVHRVAVLLKNPTLISKILGLIDKLEVLVDARIN